MEKNVNEILKPVQNEGKKVKIGLIGLGTVGSGVFKTLRAFDNVEVTKIAVRNLNKQRNIDRKSVV